MTGPTLTISSDASAVSGKPDLPAGWAAVIEADFPGISGSVVLAGCSRTSEFGVLGAELRGLVTGLYAASFILPEEETRRIRVDLLTDSAHLDRMVRGVYPRKRKGCARWWALLDDAGPRFGSVSIQWRPRNSSRGLERADRWAGMARTEMSARMPPGAREYVAVAEGRETMPFPEWLEGLESMFPAGEGRSKP